MALPPRFFGCKFRIRYSLFDYPVSYILNISETGGSGSGAGIQHILEQHSKEFAKYEPQQLAELAEASTSLGLRVGSHGRGTRSRPIFGLFFYGEPIAIAVQVGSNGSVVSMNPYALEKVIKKNPHHGSVNELFTILRRSHSWPIA